jgi:hypothetical protein
LTIRRIREVLNQKKSQSPMMRQVHEEARSSSSTTQARNQAFNPTTGEVQEVEPFVGGVGVSNLTYAEATLTQRVEISSKVIYAPSNS